MNATPTSISRRVALTAFANLADRWEIPKANRHELLGVPADTAKQWFSNLSGTGRKHERPLDPATLERISHLLGIYEALHRMFDPIAADAWIRNKNEAFGGKAPLMLLTNGRFEDVIVVRHYVDQMLNR